MLLFISSMREPDAYGEGHYGASRGKRTHKGRDEAAYPGMYLLSKTRGKVTKLGYPYGDDLFYRYVEVTDEKDHKIRYFYIEPMVSVGEEVHGGTVLGCVQDLDKRYKGITPHVHVEVKDPKGRFIEPKRYLEENDK